MARLPKVFFGWGIFQLLIGRTGLNRSGWFKSIWRGKAVDQEGNPIPWITYPCIYFLEHRLPVGLAVFEYGSGNSTMWWAKRAKSIVSIEYDKSWFDKVSQLAPKNAKVKFYNLDDGYEMSVLNEPGEFDVIVVDGRKRIECAQNATKKLKSGGIIIWDNTNRDRYKDGIIFLEKKGFKRVDFYGMGPISPKNSLTSIFYRDKNILGL